MRLFPFPPIKNDRKWLYQLLTIKYELKLPSEATPTSYAIQNQIQAVCVEKLTYQVYLILQQVNGGKIYVTKSCLNICSVLRTGHVTSVRYESFCNFKRTLVESLKKTDLTPDTMISLLIIRNSCTHSSALCIGQVIKG